MSIQGIGNGTQRTQKGTNVRLRSRMTGFAKPFEAYVLQQIVPPQPTKTLDIKKWPIPKNISLAEPDFNIRQVVDVLIGAEFYS